LCTCLGNLGIAWREAGELDRALRCFQEQYQLAAELGDRRSQVTAIYGQATLQVHVGNLPAAAELVRQLKSLQALHGLESEGPMLSLDALLLMAQGKHEQAARAYAALAEEARQRGELHELGIALGSRASCLAEAGDRQGALQGYRQEEEVCRRIGDRPGLATCLANQASIWHKLGDLKSAIAAVGEAASLVRQVGNRRRLAALLAELLGLNAEAGELDEATRLAEETRDLCLAFGLTTDLGSAWLKLAKALSSRKEHPRALELAVQAECWLAAPEAAAALVRCLGIQGEQQVALGDHERALDCYRRCAELHRRAGLKGALAAALMVQSGLLRQLGKLEEAAQLVEEMEQVGQEASSFECLREALVTRAELARQQQNQLGALAVLERLSDLCRKMGRHEELVGVLRRVSSLAYGLGRFEQAQAKCLECEEAARQVGNSQAEAAALVMQGMIARRQARFQDALVLCDRAMKLMEERGDQKALLEIQVNRALVIESLGNREEAVAIFRRCAQQYRDLQDYEHLYRCLQNEAAALADLERVDEALAVMREQEQLAQTHGGPSRQALVLLNFGLLAINGQGRFQEGLQRLAEALELTLENEMMAVLRDARPGIAKALFVAAQQFGGEVAPEDLSRATGQLARIVHASAKLRFDEVLLLATEALANAHALQGHFDEALAAVDAGLVACKHSEFTTPVPGLLRLRTALVRAIRQAFADHGAR
jgi:tetratricopeptide (TPR) repeat protein